MVWTLQRELKVVSYENIVCSSGGERTLQRELKVSHFLCLLDPLDSLNPTKGIEREEGIWESSTSEEEPYKGNWKPNNPHMFFK